MVWCPRFTQNAKLQNSLCRSVAILAQAGFGFFGPPPCRAWATTAAAKRARTDELETAGLRSRAAEVQLSGVYAIGRSGNWIVGFSKNRPVSGQGNEDFCGLNGHKPIQNPFTRVRCFVPHPSKRFLDRFKAAQAAEINDSRSRNRPILTTQQSNFETCLPPQESGVSRR